MLHINVVRRLGSAIYVSRESPDSGEGNVGREVGVSGLIAEDVFLWDPTKQLLSYFKSLAYHVYDAACPKKFRRR